MLSCPHRLSRCATQVISLTEHITGQSKVDRPISVDRRNHTTASQHSPHALRKANEYVLSFCIRKDTTKHRKSPANVCCKAKIGDKEICTGSGFGVMLSHDSTEVRSCGRRNAAFHLDSRRQIDNTDIHVIVCMCRADPHDGLEPKVGSRSAA